MGCASAPPRPVPQVRRRHTRVSRLCDITSAGSGERSRSDGVGQSLPSRSGVSMNATAMQALQQQIEAIGQGVDGIVGVYVKDLATGAEVAHNADTVSPMASVVKIPI